MKKWKSEPEYQAYLKKKRIPALFNEDENLRVLKNDAQIQPGIPDLSVTLHGKAAYLEVKISKDAEHQPNQDYYVNNENDNGGFGRFIYPENEKEVLRQLKDYMSK